MLVMVTYWPSRAADLIRYQLLILHTRAQFGGLAWYNYDEAFRRDAAACQVADWSAMHLELYNFHTSAATRLPPPPVGPVFRESTGASFGTTICRSWNLGRCVASRAVCRYLHICDLPRCRGSHRHIHCPNQAACTAQHNYASTTWCLLVCCCITLFFGVPWLLTFVLYLHCNKLLNMSRAYFSFLRGMWVYVSPLASILFCLACPRLGIDAPIATVTPLVLDEFTWELAEYPSSKQRYVLDGIRLGFHIGLEPHRVSLRSLSSNMRSALDHAEVVNEYLSAELAASRLAGRFNHPPIPALQVSPFGVIPKNHQPGKWRLILDLSFPAGHSVNNGIPKDPYSLKYVTVDDTIRSLVDLSPGVLMAKFDVKAAYRNIPMHPDDRYLLGMK